MTADFDAGAAAVKRLPNKIKIGPHDYRIEVIHDLTAASRGEWGFNSAIELKISLQQTFPSPTRAAETFLHEVGHGVFNICHIGDGEKEEEIITRTTKMWVAVYRDNPWLLDWIKECMQ